ncbi:MAG: iron ABC transporter permease [Spirochaetales bacterium]|nr:iron ABC transporter permease [Spirochaetales bacterium]
MIQSKFNRTFLLLIVLLGLILLSLSSGEIRIEFKDVILSLFGKSTSYNNSLIQNLRLPRILGGAAIGAALSISGLLTSTALKNPLADSGILGIQSGATVGALITLLLLPSLTNILPLFSFAGGLVAFILLLIITTSSSGFKPGKIVLVGVAINSIGTSIIGIITILNVYKLRDAITWLSGSLVTITKSQMGIILIYTGIFILISYFLIPVLKVLLLEDSGIINLGYNPVFLRIIVSLIAVMLASIGVAFSGVISFIGIIAPQLAKRIVGQNLTYLLPCSAVIGGVLIVTTDLFQKIVFSPMEIPVGILIGVLGAPLFIVLAKGEQNG